MTPLDKQRLEAARTLIGHAATGRATFHDIAVAVITLIDKVLEEDHTTRK